MSDFDFVLCYRPCTVSSIKSFGYGSEKNDKAGQKQAHMFSHFRLHYISTYVSTLT